MRLTTSKARLSLEVAADMRANDSTTASTLGQSHDTAACAGLSAPDFTSTPALVS